MDRLKIALVGAGRRGAGAHLPVIVQLADVFDFVAICDKDEETVQSLAAEHGVKAYTSVRDLVDNEDIDIADVVVPGVAHHAICCFLAQAGVHQIVGDAYCDDPTGIRYDDSSCERCGRLSGGRRELLSRAD